MEARLNDGEVIIEARRSAHVPNVIQQFIHQASFPFAQDCQMRDATSEVPHLTSLAKDFKDAIAEDQQARTGRVLAQLSLEIYATNHPHHQPLRLQTDSIRLAMTNHTTHTLSPPLP